MKRILDFRGVKLEIVPEIYMPREDSFLFIDNLKYEMVGENVFTEIGVGSGTISLSIGDKSSSIIGIDINMIAALISKKNNIPLVLSDQGGLTTHPDLKEGKWSKKILIKLNL